MKRLAPNQRDVAAATPGIGRNMQAPDPIGPGAFGVDTLSGTGGGDLNGTAALIFFHQAGTDGSRLGTPRAMPGTITGIV